ncbi:DUF4145 domain-containing protein [Bradyrhizobium sp. Arg816]|uniref:DUF4145 domain-containing protein n=1 Tax=Bradyrhizobium sp. Arg816 TaxID=2998491 RepID=UPI00249E6F17|nr:DUF4145 domain-containing protein [Bradyrhizobium sp. Arg816]MDI3560012.1 DUF4145 domain-containing protein [Bradyrhizobium sp. Arg816]
MDWLQFTSSIVQSVVSLAWPAAFVAAVWLFREKLTELLPQLRARYKDVEVSFRLDQAEKEAAQLPPPPPGAEPAKASPEELSKFEKLVAISPRAAILDLRSSIEESIRSLADARWPGKPYRGMWTMIRELKNVEAIDSNTFGLLDDLRIIGNAAAHPSTTTSFSAEDAHRFRKLAEQIIPRLHLALMIN